MSKKRSIIEANLRIALGAQYSPEEIKPMVKDVFKNFACNCMDLLCLPKIKNEGLEKAVIFEGRENLVEALSAGKGCILTAVHGGSWELANLVSSMCGRPYSVVVNDQKKAPLLNELLNDYRRLAGAKVIYPGSATREIIRALQANEIVCIILDQGGKDGLPVDFFGKTASMSTGAIRLGLKYQAPICLGSVQRQADGKNVIKISPAITLQASEDMERDLVVNTQKVVKTFEEFLRNHPSEYMWFYKVYKYTTQMDVMILDDGKTGHLRQSQAVAEALNKFAVKNEKQVRSKTITIQFKGQWHQKAFGFYCFLAQGLSFLRREACLKFFLKLDCYRSLMAIKPDYIISCGSQTSSVSFILSRLNSVKSIHILKPNILNTSWFSLVIFPEHDKPQGKTAKNMVFTKVALSLINTSYLKEQQERLFFRFPQFKGNVRSKIGVLLGGDTKGVEFDVAQMRSLVRQLKEAAKHYNMDLLLTTSRRTPSAVDEMIVKELRNFERCSLLVIANEANIPEAVGGILSLADLLIVSGESISMVSESLSSGKKTIVFNPSGNYSDNPANKYDRFVLNLNAQGYLLACSIKDVSDTISRAMTQKISVKSLDDKDHILKALESIV